MSILSRNDDYFKKLYGNVSRNTRDELDRMSGVSEDTIKHKNNLEDIELGDSDYDDYFGSMFKSAKSELGLDNKTSDNALGNSLFDNYETKKQDGRIDRQIARNKSKGLLEPKNASSNSNNTTNTEEEKKPFYKKIPVASDITGGLIGGVASAGRTYAEWDYKYDMMKAERYKNLANNQNLTEERRQHYQDKYEKEVAQAEYWRENNIQTAEKMLDYANSFSTIKEDDNMLVKAVKGAFGSLGNIATATIAGGGNGIIGMGVSTYGQSLKEAKEMNLSEEDTHKYALSTALIESGSELVLPGAKGIKTFLTTGSIKQAVKEAGVGSTKEFIKQVGAEFGQEAGTEVANIINERRFEDKDGNPIATSDWRELGERIMVAGLSGAIMGGVTEGAGRINKAKNNQAQNSVLSQQEDTNIKPETAENTVNQTNITAENANKAKFLTPQAQKLNDAFGFDVSNLIEENINGNVKTENSTSEIVNNAIPEANNNPDTIFKGKSIDAEGNSVYVKEDGTTINSKLFDLFAESNNIDVNKITRLSETEMQSIAQNESVEALIETIEDSVIEEGAEATVKSLNESLNSGAIDTATYDTAVNLVNEINTELNTATQQESVQDNTTQHEATQNNAETLSNKAKTIEKAVNTTNIAQQEATQSNTTQQEAVNVGSTQHKATQNNTKTGILVPNGITAEQLDKAYKQDPKLKSRMEEASKVRQNAEAKLKEAQKEVKKQAETVNKIDEKVNKSKTVKEVSKKAENTKNTSSETELSKLKADFRKHSDNLTALNEEARKTGDYSKINEYVEKHNPTALLDKMSEIQEDQAEAEKYWAEEANKEYLDKVEKLNKVVNGKDFKAVFTNLKLEVIEKLTVKQDAVNQLGKAIGREVIFFNANSKNAPNGFMRNNTIFLNGGYGGSAMAQVLGHETFHTLKTTNKETFNKLVEYGKENFTAEEITQFLSKIDNEAEVNKLKNNPDLLSEEMLAEAFGNDFANKEFWKGIEKKNKSLFEKIKDIIAKIFNRAKSYKTDFLTQKHIDELRVEFEGIFGDLTNNHLYGEFAFNDVAESLQNTYREEAKASKKNDFLNSKDKQLTEYLENNLPIVNNYIANLQNELYTLKYDNGKGAFKKFDNIEKTIDEAENRRNSMFNMIKSYFREKNKGEANSLKEFVEEEIKFYDKNTLFDTFEEFEDLLKEIKNSKYSNETPINLEEKVRDRLFDDYVKELKSSKDKIVKKMGSLQNNIYSKLTADEKLVYNHHYKLIDDFAGNLKYTNYTLEQKIAYVKNDIIRVVPEKSDDYMLSIIKDITGNTEKKTKAKNDVENAQNTLKSISDTFMKSKGENIKEIEEAQANALKKIAEMNGITDYKLSQSQALQQELKAVINGKEIILETGNGIFGGLDLYIGNNPRLKADVRATANPYSELFKEQYTDIQTALKEVKETKNEAISQNSKPEKVLAPKKKNNTSSKKIKETPKSNLNKNILKVMETAKIEAEKEVAELSKYEYNKLSDYGKEKLDSAKEFLSKYDEYLNTDSKYLDSNGRFNSTYENDEFVKRLISIEAHRIAKDVYKDETYSELSGDGGLNKGYKDAEKAIRQNWKESTVEYIEELKDKAVEEVEAEVKNKTSNELFKDNELVDIYKAFKKLSVPFEYSEHTGYGTADLLRADSAKELKKFVNSLKAKFDVKNVKSESNWTDYKVTAKVNGKDMIFKAYQAPTRNTLKLTVTFKEKVSSGVYKYSNYSNDIADVNNLVNMIEAQTPEKVLAPKKKNNTSSKKVKKDVLNGYWQATADDVGVGKFNKSKKSIEAINNVMEYISSQFEGSSYEVGEFVGALKDVSDANRRFNIDFGNGYTGYIDFYHKYDHSSMGYMVKNTENRLSQKGSIQYKDLTDDNLLIDKIKRSQNKIMVKADGTNSNGESISKKTQTPEKVLAPKKKITEADFINTHRSKEYGELITPIYDELTIGGKIRTQRKIQNLIEVFDAFKPLGNKLSDRFGSNLEAFKYFHGLTDTQLKNSMKGENAFLKSKEAKALGKKILEYKQNERKSWLQKGETLEDLTDDRLYKTDENGDDVKFSTRRGKEFDNWFKGSVMVKGDGTPEVYYHRTDSVFDDFNDNAETVNGKMFGAGHYFAFNAPPSRYGTNELTVNLNLKSPFYDTDFISADVALKMANEIESTFGLDVVDDVKARIEDNEIYGWYFLNAIKIKTNNTDMRGLFKKYGYDGLVVRESMTPQIVAFYNDQVNIAETNTDLSTLKNKLANIEYSLENSTLTESQRKYHERKRDTLRDSIARLENGDDVKFSTRKGKEFDNWFKGSVMVKENGKPQLFYHTTNAKFDDFDDNAKTINGRRYGAGHYFTDKRPQPGYGYGKNRFSVNLKIENPLDFSKNIDIDKAKNIARDLDKEFGATKYGEYRTEKLEKTIKSFGENGEIPVSFFSGAIQIENSDYRDILRKYGYDGIIEYSGGEHYVVAFYNDQVNIKSRVDEDGVKFSTRSKEETSKITAPLQKVAEKTNNLQLRAGIHKLQGVKVDKNVDLVGIFNNAINSMASNTESTKANIKTLKNALMEEGISSKEANAIAKYFTNIIDVAKETFIETAPVSKNVITSSSYKGKNKGIKAKTKEAFDSFYTHIIDTNHAGKMVNDVFYNKAKTTKNSFGVVDNIFTEALINKNGNVVDKSLKEMFDNVFKADDITEFMDYALHKHNISRALQGKYVFFKEDGSPMKSTDSAKIVKQYEAKHSDFASRQEELTGWINTFMETWAVDTGLMSKDFHSMLKEMYNHYVPTNRSFADHEELFGGGYGGKGFVDKSKPTKRAEKGGSARDIIDLQESVVNLVSKTVRTAKMNEVGQELVKAIQNNPNMKGIAEIVDKPDINVDNVVRVLVEGEPVYVEVQNKPLLEMLEQVHTPEFHAVIEASRKSLNVVKQLITSKNPLFAITNTFRDYQTYMINSTEANVFKRWGSIGKALKAVKNNTKEYQLYKAMGISSSGIMAKNNTKTVQNITGLKSIIDKDTGALLGKKDITNSKDLQSRFIKGWNKFNEAIETLTGTSETTFRLAEFINSLDRGLTVDEATVNAMEITVDFSRSGDYTRFADAGVMYLNAGVQGLDKVARQVKKHPIQTLTRSMVHIAAPAILLSAINGGDDDYEMLDSRTKDNNFLIPLWLFGGEEGKFLKLPKAREYGVVAMICERLIYGKGEEGSFDNLWRSVKENMAPADVFSSNILTDIAKASDNEARDFAGRYIVPKALQDKEAKDQWDDNTTVLAKHLGQLLNFSPKFIDYYLDSYTGIIGDLVMPMLTPSTYASSDKKDAVSNILAPITKKFVADNAYSSSATSKYYDNLDELTNIINKEQEGLTTAEKRALTTETEAFKSAINEVFGNDISDLNDMLKDNTLTNAEKRRARQARNEAMKQANEAIKKFLSPKNK